MMDLFPAPISFDFQRMQLDSYVTQHRPEGRRPSCQPICPSDALDLLDSSQCFAVLSTLASSFQLPRQQHNNHNHNHHQQAAFGAICDLGFGSLPGTAKTAPRRTVQAGSGAGKAPRPGRKKKAGATRHMPKEASSYKTADGEWTLFLTELPTVDLNAFLKESFFSEEEIASLKKERRKRKCTVYTKRFRQKKRGSR